jgi:hypothetical protein
MENRQACRISISTTGSVNDPNTQALIDWMDNQHSLFRNAFTPIIDRLPSSLWTGEGLED